MSRLDAGVAVTVVIAMVGGALFLGKLDGRLSAIELDKDLESIKEAKTSAIQKIKEDETRAVSNIETSSESIRAELDVVTKSVADLQARLQKVEDASTANATLRTDLNLLRDAIATENQRLRIEIRDTVISGFSSFKIGEEKLVGKESCPDGTVMIAVPYELDSGGSRGYVGRIQPTCASLTVDFD